MASFAVPYLWCDESVKPPALYFQDGDTKFPLRDEAGNPLRQYDEGFDKALDTLFAKGKGKMSPEQQARFAEWERLATDPRVITQTPKPPPAKRGRPAATPRTAPWRVTLPGWPRGLREELAAAYVGVSEALLRREWAAGNFPAPVALTPGRQVWLREDLDAWLDTKAGRASPIDDTEEWLK